MAIEAFIFDLDGTIVNSTEVQWYAFNEYLDNSFKVKIPWIDWTEKYLGKKSSEIWNLVEDKLGISIDISVAQRKRRKIYQNLVRNGKLSEIKGFSELYSWLVKNFTNNIQIVIASNGHPTSIETSLRRIGYLNRIKYYSAIENNEIVSKDRLYKNVIEDLHVNPEFTYVFEDSPLGAAAAQSIGLKVIIINTSGLPERFFDTDLIFTDYTVPSLYSYLMKQ
jgi:beta-phosphoglucomutase-like phosphatase (HAD superfamily)